MLHSLNLSSKLKTKTKKAISRIDVRTYVRTWVLVVGEKRRHSTQKKTGEKKSGGRKEGSLSLAATLYLLKPPPSDLFFLRTCSTHMNVLDCHAAAAPLMQQCSCHSGAQIPPWNSSKTFCSFENNFLPNYSYSWLWLYSSTTVGRSVGRPLPQKFRL